MPTHRAARVSAFLAAALGISCGNSSNQPDPYNGAVQFDSTTIDPKFLPQTGTMANPGKCGANNTCYPAQSGYVNGQPINFYNFGNVASSAVIGTGSVALSRVLTKAYDFRDRCNPDPTYDRRLDAFAKTTQFAIFSAFPTLGISPAPLPLVAIYSVTGISGNKCNDLKNFDSIAPADASTGGQFGAKASSLSRNAMWPVVDPNATLKDLKPGVTPEARSGWFRGLQFTFLEGGTLPLDPSGNPRYMDGVIITAVDLTQPGAAPIASEYSADRRIILPFSPADPPYSPVVRLHPVNAAVGRYTGICTTACSSTQIAVPAQVANALFIVAVP